MNSIKTLWDISVGYLITRTWETLRKQEISNEHFLETMTWASANFIVTPHITVTDSIVSNKFLSWNSRANVWNQHTDRSTRLSWNFDTSAWLPRIWISWLKWGNRHERRKLTFRLAMRGKSCLPLDKPYQYANAALIPDLKSSTASSWSYNHRKSSKRIRRRIADSHDSSLH